MGADEARLLQLEEARQSVRRGMNLPLLPTPQDVPQGPWGDICPWDSSVPMLAYARELADVVPFDTVVGVNLSGSLLLLQLAEALRKKFLAVRWDDTHESPYRGNPLVDSWLFVDENICRGRSLLRAATVIWSMRPAAKLAGAMVLATAPHFYSAEACAERWLTAEATAQAMETTQRAYKVNRWSYLVQQEADEE